MDFLTAFFLGALQGVTEFLPISSSGHLWIAEHFFLPSGPSLALESFLHMATLLAVIVYFWRDIWNLLQSFFTLPSKSSVQQKKDQLLVWKLLLATLITGSIGILGKDILETQISLFVVAGTLFFTGILVLVSEYFSREKIQDFSWSIAFFLGFVQALALVPGISRSGMTIAFLLLLGIAKQQSVRISFLLSIPTILGAFVFLLPDLQGIQIDILPLLLSGGIAFIVAYITIWGMMEHLQKIWKWCALWCFLVGGVLLFVSF